MHPKEPKEQKHPKPPKDVVQTLDDDSGHGNPPPKDPPKTPGSGTDPEPQ